MKEKKIYSKIMFVYTISFLLFGCIFYFLLPVLLNYPPDSINNDFQRGVDLGLLYAEQYLIIIFLCYTVSAISIKLCTKKIDSADLTSLKDYNSKNIKIISQLFNLPYKIFCIDILIPSLSVLLLYSLSEGSINDGTIKITLAIITLVTLIALSAFIYCKNIISGLLEKLYINKKYLKNFSSLKNQIFAIILPIILVALIFSSLLGYSQIVVEKGQSMFLSNKVILESKITNNFYDLNDLKENLRSLNTLLPTDDKFIVFSDGSYISFNKQKLSPFFIKYTMEQSASQDGRTYDSYGINKQGVVKKVFVDNKPVYVGISYDITTGSTVYSLILGNIFLLILNCFVLYYIAKSIADNTRQVAVALNNIVHNNSIKHNVTLPITSNEEIAQLTIAFNEIQELTQNNIKQIQDNQSMLMEKERLASLGQMIGGIAHNLKTPIMSISGAAEGLADLTKEYDISIGDPTVTDEDHHAIVKDMNDWIEKIKTHTSYMSDVITAVKGQAVAFSETDTGSFTIAELLTYVDVLMKHELKNALITLNTSLNVPESLSIKGNINSLVQVLNNIISNAIQSYKGEPNKTIDFTIAMKNKNTLTLTVQDYGSGIPKKVQDKLFKEMITTKGKNGTGLGLFMSYSNIRAHFNGSMTFESEEGKGTKFEISIPLK